VDFLDPEIAPGVGTTVPGGPTYREAQLCMEMIADTGRLASLDIVELNPAFDVRNRTASLAVDLVESLFGKSTLMRRTAEQGKPQAGPRPVAQSSSIRAFTTPSSTKPSSLAAACERSATRPLT
jgi:arginase